MFDDSLNFEEIGEDFAENLTKMPANINLKLRFEGLNKDIMECYYWFFNFAYYVGKGYTTLKLEDYHHFSENSQFGANVRQMKGGTIRAFQENFQQLVQLIKVHLLPLLTEVKSADFYHRWINQIVKNDEKVQEELAKPQGSQSAEKLKKYRDERNEAINHIKDKWVNEVEGGRMWQMQRSSTEQGLDFSLLPQLFFGTSLDNPLYGLHHKGKSLKEQLDENIYSIDISQDAKEQVARSMYKFYTWLPSAIKDTKVSFKIKIASLKQFYAQIQMQINFMKPLLMEITRKSEGFEKKSLYGDFQLEHPDFVNMFDFSYSYVRTIGIKGFQRGAYKFSDLEFTKFGFFVTPKDIIAGKYVGKTGFIKGHKCQYSNPEERLKIPIEDIRNELVQYKFYPSTKKDITKKEFDKIKGVWIDKRDLKKFSIIELEFSQKRRGEIIQTPQGPQQQPFMSNEVLFHGHTWNIFEIASHRKSFKEKNLELLETFIGEITAIKEDLMYYINDLYEINIDKTSSKNSDSTNSQPAQGSYTAILEPLRGIGEAFGPLIPNLSFFSKSKKANGLHPKTQAHMTEELGTIEDVWKIYSVYKKSHGHMQW